MPTPILMPALSPTMEEGTLAKWKVKEGDKVSSGDVIAEIETDKATMEVEAVDEGVIGKILVPAGAEHVKVNATIAILIGEGESASDLGKPPPPVSANGGHAPKASPAASPVASPVAPSTTPSGAPPARPPAHAAPVANGRILASPLARRMAREAGLELNAISGTGPHGRIIRRDVEAAARAGLAAKAPAALQASAPSHDARPAAGIDPRIYPADSYRAVKLDGMRRTIARRLTQSFNVEVPHFPLNIDVELTRLLEARAALNALSPKEGAGAFKISVNDFVIKAAAMALMKTPDANATYTDEAILLHRHADIGVAVAIEGGLITPIVWKAETKGLAQISAEVKDLAARARARKLKPEEYQGGTFSISNLGMFGITSFASIVNQPHGAILSVGAGEERAVVRAGAIVARTMMTVTMTCDHRVVDGAVGAAFLAAFKAFVEEPSSMLL